MKRMNNVKKNLDINYGSIKKLYTICIIALLFTSLIPTIHDSFLQQGSGTVKAAIIYVDANPGGSNNSTIQDAINNASHGDTIIINETGPFNLDEPIYVNKSITITNNTGVNPVIDAKGEHGIIINASNVKIENLTIQNATGTASIHGSISILTYNASDPSAVLENIVLSNLTITNSNVSIWFGYGWGVGSNVSNSTIFNCHISDGTDTGIAIINSFNCTISYSTVFNMSGTGTPDTHKGYGIYLYESSNSTISNSTITYVNGTNNQSGFGMFLQNCSLNNVIENNNISFAKEIGIYFELSNNNTISRNNIFNTTNATGGQGISFIGSKNNTMINNSIYNHSTGMFVGMYQHPSIVSDNNTIYKNNFFNTNTYNANDLCGNNHWNSSTHGNFWDDMWMGPGDNDWDHNIDGIINTPYTILGNSGSSDYKPLREMWNGTIVTGNSNISGYVKYNTDWPVVSAVVELYDNSSRLKAQRTTNSTGFYRFENLTQGNYDLRSYKPEELPHIWNSSIGIFNKTHNLTNSNFTHQSMFDHFLSDLQSTVSPGFIKNETTQTFNFNLIKQPTMDQDLFLHNLTIDLPEGFIFKNSNGDGTTLGANYSVSNTTNSITWSKTNEDGFLFNSTENFWFNVSSTAPLGPKMFNVSARHATGSLQELSFVVFTAETFYYTGTIYNNTGSVLPGAVAEITVTSCAGNMLTTLGPFTGTSNETGEFNITDIPILQNYSDINCGGPKPQGQDGSTSFMYQLAAYEYNDSSNNYAINMSRTLPPLPAMGLKCELGDVELYLIPAFSFTVTAIGPDWDHQDHPPSISGYSNKNFSLMVKDQKLGYPVKQESTQTDTSIFSVPAGRDYSLSVFADMSFPISIRLNNISWYCENQGGDFGIDGVTTNCTAYNGTYHVTIEVNTTFEPRNLTGNFTGITGVEDMRIVAYTMETQNMVFEEYPLPFNLGSMKGWNEDTYNFTGPNYNYSVSLPATMAPSYLMLRAYAQNATGWYMASFITNTSNMNLNDSHLNFSMQPLKDGTGRSISSNNASSQSWESETIVNTKAVSFRLVNVTGSLLSSENAFVEVKRELDGKEYLTMINAENGEFNLSLVEGASIKKLTIFSQQYAPLSAPLNESILSGSVNNTMFNVTNGVCNITMRSFGEFDPLNQSLDIRMQMFLSNTSNNIPNPPQMHGLLGGGQGEKEQFSPLNAILKGDINMMISTDNITVYYINVDLLASGPPDASFTDKGDDSDFTSLWKFGSQGPDIYDYVIIGVNITDTPLEFLDIIRIDIPRLYDTEFNEIWNRTAGDTLQDIENNLSQYAEYLNKPYRAYLDGTGVICRDDDPTLSKGLGYRDTINKTIWMKIPHFSGVGATLGGSEDIYVSQDQDPSWYNIHRVRTIQEGINNASSNDTIHIWDGTYAENVNVTKSVTITANSSAVLDAAGENGITIEVSNVTIENLTIQNATDPGGFSVSILVQNQTGSLAVLENIVLSNLTINNTDVSIWFGHSGGFGSNVTNSSISNCYISNATAIGVAFFNSINCTVTNSTIFNVTGGPGIGINISANFTTIRNLQITNCSKGIELYGLSLHNISIQRNEFYNCSAAIFSNASFDNSTMIIRYNKFLGDNITMGMNFTNALEEINATLNYWGSITGANHSSNSNGTGVNVTDNVIFSPWIGENGGRIYASQLDTREISGDVSYNATTNNIVTNISINTTAPTNITIAGYSSDSLPENIPNTVRTVGGIIDIEVEDETVVTWPINITMYYKESDFNDAGITESDLDGMYRWNSTNESWEIYNKTGVNITYNVGDYDGYVWALAYTGQLSPKAMGSDNSPPNEPTGENPTDESPYIEAQPMINVTVSDPDENNMDVYFYENTTGSWVLQQTNSSVTNNTNVVWNKYTNATSNMTTYYWSVNITDGKLWTNNTYSFTTGIIPSAPTDFTAEKDGTTKIDLLWTKNSSADTTYIEFRTSASPWDREVGSYLDNVTGESKTHSTLSADTTYYYQAWSYNVSNNSYSVLYASDSATTDSASSSSPPSGGATSPPPTTPSISITDITQNPETVSSEDTVEITATITATDGVGVATLYYGIDEGSEQSKVMTGLDDSYSVTIGPFNPGVLVTYYISVVDENDETESSNTFSFEVDDITGPTITLSTPTADSTISDSRPFIIISYNDPSDIDTDSIEFLLNAVDLTDSATVTDSELSFIPSTELSIGQHTISISVADTIGNINEQTWSFTISEDEEEIVETIDDIKQGETHEVDVTMLESSIQEISFTAATDLTNVKISCSLLENRPTGVSVPANTVYQYLDISSNVDDADIDSVAITFKVELDWFTTHDIGKEQVTLLRYNDNNWQQLSTTMTNEDSSFVYYEATTPGLSTFAITGEQVEEDDTAPPSGGLPWLYIILAIIAIIIIVFVVLVKTGYIYFEHEEE